METHRDRGNIVFFKHIYSKHSVGSQCFVS
jgi:hypothetical protein